MKKTIHILLLIIISCLFLTSNVEAKNLETYDLMPKVEYHVLADKELDDFSHNCADLAKVLRLVGYALLLVEIILPLVIIVKSSLDLFDVVTSGKSDELSKKLMKLGYSLVAAIAIFFLPTLVRVVFGFINSYNTNYTEDAKICSECIFNPTGEICKKYADKEA